MVRRRTIAVDDRTNVLIARDIAAEESRKPDGKLGEVLSNGKVWLLAFVYFAIVSGLYGVTFWMPTIIKELGVADPLKLGLIGAVPWAFGIDPASYTRYSPAGAKVKG